MNAYDNLKLLLSPILENEEAVIFCCDIFQISQFWDDLIDRDRHLSDGDINIAMYKVMFEISDNRFYRENEYNLKPIMKNATIKWFASNKLEKNKEHLEKSYMLRASIYDIFAQCLFILKGSSADFTSIYKLYGEKLEDFKKEILCQIQ